MVKFHVPLGPASGWSEIDSKVKLVKLHMQARKPVLVISDIEWSLSACGFETGDDGCLSLTCYGKEGITDSKAHFAPHCQLHLSRFNIRSRWTSMRGAKAESQQKTSCRRVLKNIPHSRQIS